MKKNGHKHRGSKKRGGNPAPDLQLQLPFTHNSGHEHPHDVWWEKDGAAEAQEKWIALVHKQTGQCWRPLDSSAVDTDGDRRPHIHRSNLKDPTVTDAMIESAKEEMTTKVEDYWQRTAGYREVDSDSWSASEVLTPNEDDIHER